MSTQPKKVERTVDENAKHANALFTALHDMVIELAGSNCTCANCQTLRRNAVHVKALFTAAPKIKKSEAA